MTYLQRTTVYGDDRLAKLAVGWFASGTGAAGLVGAGLWWTLRGLGVKAGLGLSSVNHCQPIHPRARTLKYRIDLTHLHESGIFRSPSEVECLHFGHKSELLGSTYARSRRGCSRRRANRGRCFNRGESGLLDQATSIDQAETGDRKTSLSAIHDSAFRGLLCRSQSPLVYTRFL